jgi:hypothetical protein
MESVPTYETNGERDGMSLDIAPVPAVPGDVSLPLDMTGDKGEG